MRLNTVVLGRGFNSRLPRFWVLCHQAVLIWCQCKLGR